MVLLVALRSTPLSMSVMSVLNTGTGPGRAQEGLSLSHTMTCHTNSRMPVAATLGHATAQMRRAREGAGATGTSRASIPASSTSRVSVVVVGMAPDLLPQALNDLARQRRHLG